MTKRYWGSEVPDYWAGDYPDILKSVPELTDYTKTASHYETLEFISTLAWNSEYMRARIKVESKAGKGTTVTVKPPL